MSPLNEAQRADIEARNGPEPERSVDLTEELREDLEATRDDIAHFEWGSAARTGLGWSVPVLAHFDIGDVGSEAGWMAGNMVVESVAGELDYWVGDWRPVEDFDPDGINYTTIFNRAECQRASR